MVFNKSLFMNLVGEYRPGGEMLREFKGNNQNWAKPIISGKVIFYFRITLFISS